MNQTPRAIILYSGGLDSQLAVEVLLRAGVDVIALQHHSVFYPPREDCRPPRCEIVERDISELMVELVRNPHYGYGKNANPCLDCKQMMYGLAWQEAERRGAQFIATGEVLGQRPMSQRLHAFKQMERGAGVEGLVVRPLCGRLLPPTIPEKQGLIRREDLLDIRGRGRKRQMDLAAEWGITEYPSPAGGCKLTDPSYAERVFTLKGLGHLEASALLAAHHGRLFPLGEHAFALVGRNAGDNDALLADAPDDALVMELVDHPGPLVLVVGSADEEHMEEARRLVIRYSRFGDLPTSAVTCSAVTERRQA